MEVSAPVRANICEIAETVVFQKQWRLQDQLLSRSVGGKKIQIAIVVIVEECSRPFAFSIEYRRDAATLGNVLE